MDNQSELPQQPVASSPEHKSRLLLSKTVIILIVIILVFFTIIYIGIYSTLNKRVDQMTKINQTKIQAVSPSLTQDATANWKTYRNEKLGFELKYPENYMVIEETDSNVMIAKDKLGSGFVAIFSAASKQFVDYKLFKLCSDKEIQQSIQSSLTCIDQGKKWGQQEDITDIMIDGTNAKSYYLTHQGPGYTFYYIETTTDPIIEIEFETISQDKIIHDQILSTFKFIEP